MGFAPATGNREHEAAEFQNGQRIQQLITQLLQQGGIHNSSESLLAPSSHLEISQMDSLSVNSSSCPCPFFPGSLNPSPCPERLWAIHDSVPGWTGLRAGLVEGVPAHDRGWNWVILKPFQPKPNLAPSFTLGKR